MPRGWSLSRMPLTHTFQHARSRRRARRLNAPPPDRLDLATRAPSAAPHHQPPLRQSSLSAAARLAGRPCTDNQSAVSAPCRCDRGALDVSWIAHIRSSFGSGRGSRPARGQSRSPALWRGHDSPRCEQLSAGRPMSASAAMRPALRVIAAHLQKALIVVEARLDRRRVLGTLDHAFHPGLHAASSHAAVAPDAKLE